MIKHSEIENQILYTKLKNKQILYAGNQKLKIYGRLDCASGKRMLKANRVFFQDENEAIAHGYRPCGHCMKSAYLKWKNQVKMIENIVQKNLLPYDGCVNYYGVIFEQKQAKQYFDLLMQNIAWQNDQAVIYGKTIFTKRKVAWYAEQNFEYTYSKVKKYALPWTAELLELKKIVERITGETFNSCLLNLYHSGEEGMAWHSDGETDLKKNGAIASLSFGAERKFAFKHKQSKEKVEISLEHGSLLVMKDTTQSYWLHRLAPTKKVHSARINLTFRTIIEDQQI